MLRLVFSLASFVLSFTSASLALSAHVHAEAIPKLRFSVTAGSELILSGAKNAELVIFDGLELGPNPNFRSANRGGYASVSPDGSTASLSYKLIGGTEREPAQARVSFQLHDGTVEVSVKVVGLSNQIDLSHSRLHRRMSSNFAGPTLTKLGRWTRVRNGGQAVEQPDGTVLSFVSKSSLIAFATTPDYSISGNSAESSYQPLRFRLDPANGWESKLTILLSAPSKSVERLGAEWRNHPAFIGLARFGSFNWIETQGSEPRSFPLSFAVTNTSLERRTFRSVATVYDYSGRTVLKRTEMDDLLPGQTTSKIASITRDSEDRAFNMFFVEVSATDAASSQETFLRTDISLFPKLTDSAQGSERLFGMSAYFPVPTAADAQMLLASIGVRWLRLPGGQVDQRFYVLHHTDSPPTLKMDKSERRAWIRGVLLECIRERKPAWEFGNEINSDMIGVAAGVGLPAKERETRIAEYVDWLRDIRTERAILGAEGESVKIVSFGLAGMDTAFVQAFVDAGGWDLIDGFALHPGRGNVAADYDPQSDRAQAGSAGYWNFLGAVRGARSLVKRFGAKDIWLTEAYASSLPNSFWDDSARNAADNVLLSFALSKAEHVTSVFWYQLNDGVFFDVGGVNPTNREYFFGLLNRDLSFKPALMAYRVAAGHLAGAEFNGWIRSKSSTNVRGLMFSTSRGRLAILWDRSDGFLLTEPSADFASPEAWEDNWKSRASVHLPVQQGFQVSDAIGQQRLSGAVGLADVFLPLSGSPLLIYGLDIERLPDFGIQVSAE